MQFPKRELNLRLRLGQCFPRADNCCLREHSRLYDHLAEVFERSDDFVGQDGWGFSKHMTGD